MNALTKYEAAALPMSAEQVREHVNAIQAVMQAVMKKDVHYGIVPGAKKPSLYKPGAEVLCMTFHIAPSFEIEDLSTPDAFRYRLTCTGTHQTSGTVLGEGMGSASSNEEKYKWRAAVCAEEFDVTPESRSRVKWKKGQNTPYSVKQVRAEPDDIDNTVLKMACKRALIAMTLNVTAASDIFAQDIEDLPEHLRDEQPEDVAPQGIQQPQSKNGEAKPEPKKSEGGEAKPAPESMKKMIRARLDSATISETELFKKFEYDGASDTFWGALTLDRGNEALKWIANPS